MIKRKIQYQHQTFFVTLPPAFVELAGLEKGSIVKFGLKDKTILMNEVNYEQNKQK